MIPRTIHAQQLILQLHPLYFLEVEVETNDMLDGEGDNLKVVIAGALMSILLHDSGLSWYNKMILNDGDNKMGKHEIKRAIFNEIHIFHSI